MKYFTSLSPVQSRSTRSSTSLGVYSSVAPQLRQTTSFTTLGCGTVLITLTILGLQTFICGTVTGFIHLSRFRLLRNALRHLFVRFRAFVEGRDVLAVLVLVILLVKIHRIAILGNVSLQFFDQRLRIRLDVDRTDFFADGFSFQISQT